MSPQRAEGLVSAGKEEDRHIAWYFEENMRNIQKANFSFSSRSSTSHEKRRSTDSSIANRIRYSFPGKIAPLLALQPS